MTTQVCAPVGHFVATMFEQLEQQKLPYVVLRNYDGLPGHVGNDIDVLVADDNLDRFSTVLCKIATEEGWCLVQHANRYGFRSFIFVPFPNGGFGGQSLKWDVWAPISWKGFTWIDSEVALSSRQVHQNGFYIPAHGVESATLLLKELLQFGKIKKKYLYRIQQFAQLDSESFKRVLEKAFGVDVSKKLLTQAQNGDWSQIERSYGYLRSKLVRKAILDNPVSVLCNVYQFVVGHLKEFIIGHNHLTLCLIGPDGSGKSTVSSHLAESMCDIFEGTCYYHGHFGILPELKTFCPSCLVEKRRQGTSIQLIMQKIPNRLTACILMIYYSFDYILGYAQLLRDRNKGKLIIFDRYFYDYIIQPSPFGINGWLFRVLARLVPTPNVVIYLHASPELIHNRKPELTVQEINRQADICNQLVRLLPNAYHVDNSQPLNRVILQIRNIILKKMIARITSNRVQV
jgi:thymidylate kinase